MAFMNQEKKAKIAANLKKVIPADWKYSLRVDHHSKIVLTVAEAPIDLIAQSIRLKENKSNGYMQVNEFHLDHEFSGELLDTFKAIRTALNTDNFDHSDSQTDYFCVGHYVSIHIGRWNKPFKVCAPKNPKPKTSKSIAVMPQPKPFAVTVKSDLQNCWLVSTPAAC